MEARPNFKITILEDNDFYNKLIRRHIDVYIGNVALSRGFTYDLQCYTNYSDWQRNFKPDTDVIITDFYLTEGHNAIDLLAEVRRKNSPSKVIVISQLKNLTTSISSLLEGACEFIQKDKGAIERSCYIVEEIINQSLRRRYGSMPFN